MTVTTPTEPARQRRAPRWMWVALVFSVALNLLVIGMAAAAIIHFRNKHTWTGQFQQFVQTLPGDRQAVLRKVLDDPRATLRPLRRKSRQARKRAQAAFAAEPFDRAKLTEAYAEAAAARQEMTRVRIDWYAKLAKHLTAKERQAYLKWRRDHHRKRRRWRPSHHDRER